MTLVANGSSTPSMNRTVPVSVVPVSLTAHMLQRVHEMVYVRTVYPRSVPAGDQSATARLYERVDIRSRPSVR
jgi:hypothetical protein